MKLLKVTGYIACIALIFNLTGQSKQITPESYAPRDINSHWAEDSITTLVNSGIMKGNQNYVYPDKNITRGEFAALTARTLSLEPVNTQKFDDIPAGHMFYGEINALANESIVAGTGHNTFNADKTITREEIMLILSRCVEGGKEQKVEFTDISPNYKYMTELKKAISTGIITGYEDKTFKPYKSATRGECAVMLVRMLEAMSPKPLNQIKNTAENYVEGSLSEKGADHYLATGRALDEISLAETAKKTISSTGAAVIKEVRNLTLASSEIKGALSTLKYEGDITYTVSNKRNTKKRNYKAEITIDTIEKGNATYVYDYTLSLKENERINLTWDVSSVPPSAKITGINVISPSSFQISAEDIGVESKNILSDIKLYNSLTYKYMDYADTNGYKVWPIYKTDFTLKTADRFLNNTEARQKTIGHITEYACKYNIDGLNIDFENIYENNRYLVTKHAREIAVMLHEMGLIVSADITRLEPTSANWSMCYDRDALAKNIDYIMLMAYDEYYASSKSAGSVASLDWVEESIKRTLKEVPENKLILGIPFYMRYFELTGNKVTSTKAISMQTAYVLIQKNNPTYTYIESDGQYKISWKNGSKTCVFWLENTDTVKKRIELANKYSLKGVASWRRGLEISKVWEVIEDNL